MLKAAVSLLKDHVKPELLQTVKDNFHVITGRDLKEDAQDATFNDGQRELELFRRRKRETEAATRQAEEAAEEAKEAAATRSKLLPRDRYRVSDRALFSAKKGVNADRSHLLKADATRQRRKKTDYSSDPSYITGAM